MVLRSIRNHIITNSGLVGMQPTPKASPKGNLPSGSKETKGEEKKAKKERKEKKEKKERKEKKEEGQMNKDKESLPEK